MLLIIAVSPTLVAVVLSLVISVACGYWAGVIGARYVEPENRASVIGAAIVVSVLVLGVLTPLVWWIFSPKAPKAAE